MPSTLLFKFNNFHNISGSRGELIQDEYSDVTTKEGEWKVSRKPTGKLAWTDKAQDHCGNRWSIRIEVDYFFMSTGGVNTNVDEYDYRVYPSKVEPEKSKVARSLGYSITSSVTLIVRDIGGTAVKKREFTTDSQGYFRGVYATGRHSLTWPLNNNTPSHFIDGPSARSVLQDNALIIEMVVEGDVVDLDSFNQPRNSFVNNALDLLDSGESADVWFEVNGSIIPSHKLILQMNARQLYSFFTISNTNTVEIKGTTLGLFRFMLTYIYGDDKPDFDYMVENYQEIISLTDKYNIIGLKLKAQIAKVASLSIDADNVTEVLLFAHNKNCFLLKEYATEIYVSNFKDLVHTDSFNELATAPELLRELMIAVNGLTCNNNITVNELIGNLIERELDTDGPRDVLISRLLEYENRHEDDEEDDEENEESE